MRGSKIREYKVSSVQCASCGKRYMARYNACDKLGDVVCAKCGKQTVVEGVVRSNDTAVLIMYADGAKKFETYYL